MLNLNEVFNLNSEPTNSNEIAQYTITDNKNNPSITCFYKYHLAAYGLLAILMLLQRTRAVHCFISRRFIIQSFVKKYLTLLYINLLLIP